MLRFVDKTDVVREEFISFLLCEFGTTGEALSKIIITALNWVLNIVVNKAMMEQAILVRSMKVLRLKSPKGSIFALRSSCIKLMHCCSVYSVQAIINMHGTMQEICLFFNLSPKTTSHFTVEFLI